MTIDVTKTITLRIPASGILSVMGILHKSRFHESVFSRPSNPFHMISTPMHSNTNASTRTMPLTVCGETRAMMAGA
jgi:hypothetical protein